MIAIGDGKKKQVLILFYENISSMRMIGNYGLFCLGVRTKLYIMLNMIIDVVVVVIVICGCISISVHVNYEFYDSTTHKFDSII